MAAQHTAARWEAQPFVARVERPLIVAQRVAPPFAVPMEEPRLADPMAGPPIVRPEVLIMAEQQFIAEAPITARALASRRV
jgi:hypothetical protein